MWIAHVQEEGLTYEMHKQDMITCPSESLHSRLLQVSHAEEGRDLIKNIDFYLSWKEYFRNNIDARQKDLPLSDT